MARLIASPGQPRVAPATQARMAGEAALEAVVRLYLVVHGRPPDPTGLAFYTSRLQDGTPLPMLADEFVRSPEFADRVRGQDAAAVLYRHALGEGATPPPDARNQSPGDLAAALVSSPAVQRRLEILPTLYPDGVPLDPADYRTWLSQRPDPRPAPAGDQRLALLSFVMLLDRPNPAWLADAVQSVLAANPAAELVAAARWPVPRQVRAALGCGSRVRLACGSPLRSCRADRFNKAMACCRGEFTALIGQHDRLDPSAGALGDLGNADIVITDDDRLGTDGLRRDPRFGTAWNPDRVLAAGCPGLVLVRTALLRRVGGMPHGDGGEAALLLAAAAATDEARIVHVPRVALSRREGPGASPGGPAAVAAAARFLRAKGQDGSACLEDGLVRVEYPLPDPPPLVSIIVPTKNRADLLRRCVEGVLARTDYPALEVVIVDNGSTELAAVRLLRRLARDRRVRVVPRPGAFNWSALNNAGVDAMRGTVAVLLNNDTDVLDSGWLREMVSQAMRPEVGAVGAKLLYGNGAIQHAGVVLGPDGRGIHAWRFLPGGIRGYEDQLAITRRVSAVTGACLAIRRDVYRAAGGCDAEHLPVTWNDVDLCLRVRALGLHTVWTPHARLLHLEQASRGTDDTPENQVRFRREQAWMRHRWGDAISRDPFWNPNLLPCEATMRLVSRFN